MEKITVKRLKDILRKYKCAHERCTIRLSQKKAGLIAQAKKHNIMPKAAKAAPKAAPKKARKKRKKVQVEEPEEDEEEAPKPKPKKRKRRKKKKEPEEPVAPRRSSRRGRKKIDYSGMGG